ncbi:MAG: hypothetical protein IPL89_07095 [Acidobacteria bacterium]|nr:hypothetical protein [Acidobacteriota bacterium]
MRKAAFSRTASTDRGTPPPTRSSAIAAGTLWPKVPPKPGVEVCASARTAAEAEVTRIAPKSAVFPNTDPRTSENVVDRPAGSGNESSGPPRPSASCPRNFSWTVASDAPVFATVTSVV